MQKLTLLPYINEYLHSKNPESIVLGKKNVQQSIVLVDSRGFETFKFKKLGDKIGSNESSIYRYFKSKHALLLYLFNWYRSWIKCNLVFTIKNINNTEEKNNRPIQLLCKGIQNENNIPNKNKVILNCIIICESVKVYLTKDIDNENVKGYFKTHKWVLQRLSKFLLNINPDLNTLIC